MKVNKTYLKGKSVFIVSLLVIGIVILTVYLTGINYNRSLSSNIYLSLGIIATTLFLFMTYGLYKGIGLFDNFPKYRNFKSGDFLASSGTVPDLPSVDAGDGIGDLILTGLLWLVISILFIVLLLVLEAIIWFSILVILTMLYWIFFKALKLVLSRSTKTKGKIGVSVVYSLTYTAMYMGWIYAIVFLTEIIK
ncbi:hypothetical protein [Xanthovirga aplysinae]|uniref:hypothetical protein n=1 Tax=Xanthovirga aplysinae TaxID=2529853 RepID=UPI0012BD4ACD|nr:hypothetical protein [Xanthovirga aplysinae]MTI29465.1 hypothetical protein [Xanthovirga aplysinae]